MAGGKDRCSGGWTDRWNDWIDKPPSENIPSKLLLVSLWPKLCHMPAEMQGKLGLSIAVVAVYLGQNYGSTRGERAEWTMGVPPVVAVRGIAF